MSHLIVHRSILGPGELRVSCSCGWTVTGATAAIDDAGREHTAPREDAP